LVVGRRGRSVRLVPGGHGGEPLMWAALRTLLRHVAVRTQELHGLRVALLDERGYLSVAATEPFTVCVPTPVNVVEHQKLRGVLAAANAPSPVRLDDHQAAGPTPGVVARKNLLSVLPVVLPSVCQSLFPARGLVPPLLLGSAFAVLTLRHAHSPMAATGLALSELCQRLFHAAVGTGLHAPHSTRGVEAPAQFPQVRAPSVAMGVSL
jgi:hypothetical protein